MRRNLRLGWNVFQHNQENYMTEYKFSTQTKAFSFYSVGTDTPQFSVWTDTYTLTIFDVQCTIWWHWNNFVSEAERHSKQEVNSENQFSVSHSEAEWDSKQEVNSENRFSVSHSEAELDSQSPTLRLNGILNRKSVVRTSSQSPTLRLNGILNRKSVVRTSSQSPTLRLNGILNRKSVVRTSSQSPTLRLNRILYRKSIARTSSQSPTLRLNGILNRKSINVNQLWVSVHVVNSLGDQKKWCRACCFFYRAGDRKQNSCQAPQWLGLFQLVFTLLMIFVCCILLQSSVKISF